MSSIGKNNSDFFQNFPMISLAKKRKKNENGKIRHYSFKMADNDLIIWQNYLLPNTFHMVDAKFDLVLRPISQGNPAMLFKFKNLKFSRGKKTLSTALGFESVFFSTQRFQILKFKFI